jgi:hypothetical protein
MKHYVWIFVFASMWSISQPNGQVVNLVSFESNLFNIMECPSIFSI